MIFIHYFIRNKYNNNVRCLIVVSMPEQGVLLTCHYRQLMVARELLHLINHTPQNYMLGESMSKTVTRWSMKCWYVLNILFDGLSLCVILEVLQNLVWAWYYKIELDIFSETILYVQFKTCWTCSELKKQELNNQSTDCWLSIMNCPYLTIPPPPNSTNKVSCILT